MSRIRLLLWTSLSLLPLFAHAQIQSPESGSFYLYPERIMLKDGGFAQAQRGLMFVPANRSNENSGVIAVEVYRFKASAQADPDTPPIFFLQGGPRFVGLERSFSEPGVFEERWQPFLDVADLVVVGQRGIGSSKPSTVIETTTTARAPDQPYDDAKAVAAFQAVMAQEKAAWESSGVDLAGLTVIEAAADVNDVRKALGYDKITIWGGSFGSHWGMALMRYHPEIVARAILRGMEGPDHTYDHPGHILNVYARVAEEAEAIPWFADRIPEGGLIEAMKQVIDRVDREPLAITVRRPDRNTETEVLFDGHTIRRIIRGYSGGLTAWPADIIALANDDFEKAAQAIVSQYYESENRYAQYRDQTRESYLGRTFLTASYFALDCGSGITPERRSRYETDPAWEILGDLNWKYTAGCPVWNVDLGDRFRQNFETEIPTVIVNGTWDTSTPYENALELLPYFKQSKFVKVKRGPHGSIRAGMAASESFRDGIWEFARTGETSGLPDSVEVRVEWVIPEVK
jgi:pimeloyl-ACP methyl ester carboxylesterase